MAIPTEKDRLYARIDRLEEQVKRLVQLTSKQNTELANINLRWATTFQEDPSAWIKKEDLVKILVAQGFLQQVEARKSGSKRDLVRFFTDKVRRDQTFEVFEGEGKPPVGTTACKQGTRILYHRLNAVEHFKKFYNIETL